MPKLKTSKKRIGVCFFIESNLGGAATQASDLVQVAMKLGHEACLLRFTTSPRAKNLYLSGLPNTVLQIGPTGMRFNGPKVLLSDPVTKKTRELLESFDVLIFVGGCPHITRTFSDYDFFQYYEWMYKLPAAKYMFFTDPFWKKLYPFCKDVVKHMNGVYAFAEAYRNMVIETGLHPSVDICNFGSIPATELAMRLKQISKSSDKVSKIIWPHQWRSWKNPDLFVKMVPHLDLKSVGYADGIEYHKIRRDIWSDWCLAVSYDHNKQEQFEKKNKLEYFGTVPQDEILRVFSTNKWMIDLTGMSARTGKPLDKFIGNYQCVNMECMMLGCVNLKYENTIMPYSQIPEECVVSLPLVTHPVDLARIINTKLKQTDYLKVSARAREWSLETFDPMKVFTRCFLKETI